MSEDMSKELSEGMSGERSKEISEDISEDMQIDMSKICHRRKSSIYQERCQKPEEISEDMSKKIFENISIKNIKTYNKRNAKKCIR